MKLSVKDMALCALFAALISISAYVSIELPGGVPFSMQVMMAMLAGAILGSKRGAISMIVYTLVGLAGAPVFAGGRGGFAIVAGGTFGYILGFIACAFVVGLIVERTRDSEKFKTVGYIVAPFVGMIVVYLIGVPYMMMIVNIVKGGDMNLSAGLAAGFTPFIVVDILKASLVANLTITAVPRLKAAGVLE